MARMYDPDGWMLTDENEMIAVARDSSYKEAVRHGRTMISLLVAEIGPPPIFYCPNYPRKDPMSKKTHGPTGYETNPRKRNRTGMGPKTRRNRACKLLSREKKRHPKYVYRRFSPLCVEIESDITTLVKDPPSPPVICDNISSLRIRIPTIQEEEEDEYEDEMEEYNFWKDEYRMWRD